jgi:phosphotriesterase-related protein
MGHLERTVQDVEAVIDLAATGCYLEYDLFGWEASYYPLSHVDMPNDAQRIGYVARLVDAGLATRVLIAQDICFKHRLTRYGGLGYGHILTNIVPRMREKGISDEDLHSILEANPARILAFA